MPTQQFRNDQTLDAHGPHIVFAGGGYGSGKSTALHQLTMMEKCFPAKGMIGVDMFKQLIPEFQLIKAVADGRASATVQSECMGLLNRLYPVLIEYNRSFVLDSSMSDEKETLTRIHLARAAGYELTMVAVLAPVDFAIHLAMHRAKLTRRFPNKDALPNSNVAFKKLLLGYIDLFDNVIVLVNQGLDMEVVKVAEKKNGKQLVVYDEKLFTAAHSVP